MITAISIRWYKKQLKRYIHNRKFKCYKTVYGILFHGQTVVATTFTTPLWGGGILNIWPKMAKNVRVDIAGDIVGQNSHGWRTIYQRVSPKLSVVTEVWKFTGAWEESTPFALLALLQQPDTVEIPIKGEINSNERAHSKRHLVNCLIILYSNFCDYFQFFIFCNGSAFFRGGQVHFLLYLEHYSSFYHFVYLQGPIMINISAVVLSEEIPALLVLDITLHYATLHCNPYTTLQYTIWALARAPDLHWNIHQL